MEPMQAKLYRGWKIFLGRSLFNRSYVWEICNDELTFRSDLEYLTPEAVFHQAKQEVDRIVDKHPESLSIKQKDKELRLIAEIEVIMGRLRLVLPLNPIAEQVLYAETMYAANNGYSVAAIGDILYQKVLEGKSTDDLIQFLLDQRLANQDSSKHPSN